MNNGLNSFEKYNTLSFVIVKYLSFISCIWYPSSMTFLLSILSNNVSVNIFILLWDIDIKCLSFDKFNEHLSSFFDEPIVPKIWPRMLLLIGCGSGGFINYLKKIKEFTSPDFNFALVGLTASEGIFSLFTELNNHNAKLK